jgi:Tol biopolymer transport system component
LQPAVSPDGKTIAFTARSSGDKETQNYNIFILDIEGKTTTQLTFGPGDDINPRWSADGQFLFFLSDRESGKNKFNIWKMKAF